MTPQQFLDAIEKLGLNQSSAARFLGVNDRTVRKWVAGRGQPPASTAMLFSVMIAKKLTPEKVAAMDAGSLLRGLK